MSQPQAAPKPERYEDVVGPARKSWHESLAKFRVVATLASAEIDSHAAIIKKIDSKLSEAPG